MKDKRDEVLLKEIRTRGIVGIVEHQGIYETGIHFSEWWNGEGMDFVVTNVDSGDERNIALSSEEMTVLAAIWLKSGFIDLKEVSGLSKDIKKKKY